MSATTPPRIGIVLAGGGAKGAYQVGCLRALRAAGLPQPAALSGTSVGAINSVMFALDKLDTAETLWRRARWSDVAAVTTRGALRLPLWVLAGLVSEFSPVKVWRLSESMTHPVRWRRWVYPSACLATALGLWIAGALIPGARVTQWFSLIFVLFAVLALAHAWLRAHFLGSSAISNAPLGRLLAESLTEQDCARLRAQGTPLYATISTFLPRTAEAVPWGGWAPRYIRLDQLDRSGLLDVLIRGSALPGFSASSHQNGTTIVDGSWTDNIPAAPLLFGDAATIDVLFVLYLKPRVAHHLRHNSLLSLIGGLLRRSARDESDQPAALRAWAELRWAASGTSPCSSAAPAPRIVQVAPSKRVGNFFTGTLWFSPEQAARLVELGERDMRQTLSTLASGTDAVAASLRKYVPVDSPVGDGERSSERPHDPGGVEFELLRRSATGQGRHLIPDTGTDADT